MTAADIANRYSPLGSSLFCTGDQAFPSATEGNGVLPWTTYKLLGPDDTPADPTDNPAVTGCPAIDFPGTAGNLDTLPRATTATAGAPDPLVKYFCQWYAICTVASPVEGTYFLQVQTATKANGTAAPADGTMLGSTVPLTNWPNCTYTPPPGNNVGPPWATFVATPSASDCTITGVSSTYNGQWVQVRIPIPDDYSCNYLDPNGCWSKVKFTFLSNVADTTTWAAYIEGDPVRLIE